MGRKFQRPPHPNTGRTDPFSDDEGNNPFAGENAEVVNEDDPFAPTASGPVREYQASDFELQTPHRAPLVFWLGLTGFLLALLGAGGVFAVTADDFGLQGNASAASLAPLAFLSIFPASIAWYMGYHDNRAIRAGAMDPNGHKGTWRGANLGMIGSFISGISIVMYFYQTLVNLPV